MCDLLLVHPVPTRLTLCNVMELDHKMIGHLIVKVNCLPTNHHKMMAVAANWLQQKESREELFIAPHTIVGREHFAMVQHKAILVVRGKK